MISKNVSKFREKLSISQRELGRRVGISGQMISKIENNLATPSVDTLYKIATALDVSINELVDARDLTNEDKENPQSYYFEQYLYSLGYQVIYDMEDGYIILKSKEGEYEITEKDVEDLKNSSRSFIGYKLNDMMKNSRKLGK